MKAATAVDLGTKSRRSENSLLSCVLYKEKAHTLPPPLLLRSSVRLKGQLLCYIHQVKCFYWGNLFISPSLNIPPANYSLMKVNFVVRSLNFSKRCSIHMLVVDIIEEHN